MFKSTLALRQYYEKNATLKSFYKTLINLSCGFFGSKPRKNSLQKYKINLPCNYKKNCLNYQMSDVTNSSFLLKKIPKNKHNSILKSTNLPLPLFCTIIEYGKLQVNSIVSQLCKQLPKNSFEIVYIHIDSIVIVSTSSNKNDFLASFKSKNFKKIFHAKNPGQLKLEWEMTEEKDHTWQFLTPDIMNYSCMSENCQIYRSIGISKKLMNNIFDRQLKTLN